MSLKNLPSTYDHRNTSAFKQFISVYGTHFIRRVHLGGRVKSMTAIRTCEAAMSQMSVHTISSCLSVEAEATIAGVSVSAAANFCRSKSKRLKKGATFKQAFSDRTTDVLGGDGGVGDILFQPNGAVGFKKWLVSLKTVPGLVSYQISPLHLLVKSRPIGAPPDFFRSRNDLLSLCRCPTTPSSRRASGAPLATTSAKVLNRCAAHPAVRLAAETGTAPVAARGTAWSTPTAALLSTAWAG